MSKHEPGRELDALMAEKVMGWTWSDADAEWIDRGNHLPGLPKFSTNIAAAWEVVDKVAETQFIEVYNALVDPVTGESDWNCRIGKNDQHEGTAKTAPYAICLAALQMAEYEST